MTSPAKTLSAPMLETLLPKLRLASLDPHNPVVVEFVPPPWQCLGAGNYAAVFWHPDYSEQVVKVYAPGRPGIEAETEVYRRLGQHPAFSCCYASGANFLILRRLEGITLYDCLHRGMPIPSQVMRDIDAALDYARDRGLFPHDVHGRNVMLSEGRGLVVDISDFLETAPCRAWEDLKRAYWWIYRPIIMPVRLRIPYWMLDSVRAAYRWFRRGLRLLRSRQSGRKKADR
ncbi:MAG: serine/threonine protein kinase [Cyanobacteria bacterium P01_C01_bin.120]